MQQIMGSQGNPKSCVRKSCLGENRYSVSKPYRLNTLHLRINNFKKVLKKNSAGIYKIPVSLSAATNNITISTVRGSLYERLRGTYIEKAILPLITHDDLTQAKKM